MRSDDDKKNYWRKYSKFGEHEHVKKNLTLNQNNQKEIIAIKTFLIDQPFSGNDYKLHRTSCLSSNTTISKVTMMGNRVKGAGNGKRETRHGKRETGNRERVKGKGKMKNGNKNRELKMKILIGLRFQPRSQGSLLPVPTDSRRVGEKTWERGCWGSS